MRSKKIVSQLITNVPYVAYTRSKTARNLIKIGAALVFLGNILFLNGCKSERPDPDVTVRLKSLGGGYKGIKWGSSKDEVIKAFGIKPRHNFGDKEEWELDFETGSEWIDCTFSRGKFYSVRVIFKVPPSDSPCPEIANAVLNDLIKQYGRVEPVKGESSDSGITLYIWNDGETEIKYDLDNDTYSRGSKHGVVPAVYYKDLSIVLDAPA
jgi:hypothetical protein